jgi:hypothetical protein
VCLLLAGWGVRRLRQRTRPGWVSVAAIAAGAIGAVTVYDPELTTRAARAVGIARGADLLTYMVALAFLASWFYFYQKVRTLSNAVTALVRELAIRDPRLPPEPPPDGE